MHVYYRLSKLLYKFKIYVVDLDSIDQSVKYGIKHSIKEIEVLKDRKIFFSIIFFLFLVSN